MTTSTRRVQTQLRAFPSETMPRGWFQIGWSTDFVAGQPVALSYFGAELVAYRGEDSDQVSLLDAYCRHMGAHLGFGGEVEGECIRCPYHGWLYDETGLNTEVPYGTGVNTRIRIGSWRTAEVDGVVLAYHDAQEVADVPAPRSFARSGIPSWPVAGSGSTRVWPGVTMTPQLAVDNVCDAAHFTFVHGSHEIPTLKSYEAADGSFTAQYEMEFGGGAAATWVTPHGPVRGTIDTEAMGLGLLWNRMGGVDDVISLLGVTPITETTSDVRVTVWVPRQRRDGSDLDERVRDKWIAQQHSQVEADLRIWSHQSYVERPAFLAAEATPMRALRTWSSQWYA